MIYKLELNFSPQENPFIQDKNSGIIWGKIELNIIDREKFVIRQVINMVWDIRELIKWILQNEFNLYNEAYPQGLILSGNSVAEYREKYYKDRIEKNYIDDEADDLLSIYDHHHNIYYGMPGTKTINAYIGVRNEKHEISYFFDEQSNWKYNIDMPEFIENVKNLQVKYIFSK